jgi:hypothetical protein
MISDVITTNWDDFFEKEAGFDPFIYDEDLPLIEGSSRRLIKIHGSINNVGSIVATEEDYRRSFKRLNNGPLGAYLKTLMSTKTIIYVGYSLGDDNYIRLLKNISKLLGNLARQSYVVSPKIDRQHLSKLPIKLIPIETDGSYFLEELRKHLNSHLPGGCGITPDDAFLDCDELLEAMLPIHEDTAGFWETSRHPLSIFALSYQDGLIHALQRFRSKRKTADYYNLPRVQHLVHLYEEKVRSYADKADHWNACYFRGYQSGLIFLLIAGGGEQFGWPPPVDLGFEGAPDTLSKLKKFARRRVPTEFAEQAARIAATVDIGMIPDHTPYG